MSHSALTHPSITQHIGMLVEDLGVADIAEKETAHVPFEQAMNGFRLGFPVPDSIVYGAVVASIIYSAIQLKLI